MRRALIIPMREHIKTVGEIVSKSYEKYPLDFLFIGSTGFYVRQIADYVGKKTRRTINRDAFRVINQYIVEQFLTHNPNALRLDNDFFIVYFSFVIKELADSNSEYKEFLDAVKNSKNYVRYLLEIFKAVREAQLFGISEDDFRANIVKALENTDSKTAWLITQLVKRYREDFEKSSADQRKVFDDNAILKWYKDNAQFIEREKEITIFSGFLDLSLQTFQTIVPLFEKSKESLFLLWEDVNSEAFEKTRKMKENLKNMGFEIQSLSSREFGKIFPKVEVVDVQNRMAEIKYITKQIKDLLVGGESPDNIALIVPPTLSLTEIADEFEDAKIPFRYIGKNYLNESKIVNLILTPILTYKNGYRFEDIFACIESPFVTERSLTMDEIENIFKDYGYYSYSYFESNVRNEFTQKIQEKIDQLSEKLQKITDDSEDGESELDLYSALKDQKEKLESFKKTIENVFAFLENIKENWNKRDFYDWFVEYIENNVVGKLKNERILQYITDRNFAKELTALKKFLEVVAFLRELVNGKEKVFEAKDWDTNIYLLTNLTSSTSFRESFKSGGVVEITDISEARFVFKKWKFYADFIEGNYPSLKINPAYRNLEIENIEDEIVRIIEQDELTQRRDFLTSAILSENSVILNLLSTDEGEETVESPYIGLLENMMRQRLERKIYKLETVVPPIEDISTETDLMIYKLLNTPQRLQKREENFNFGSVIKERQLSHSKIWAYIKCPFKFMLKELVSVSEPVTNKLPIFEGILYHRVLAQVFQYVITSGTLFLQDFVENNLKDSISKNYDQIFDTGYYSYSIVKELYTNKVVKNISGLISSYEKTDKKGNPKYLGKVENVNWEATERVEYASILEKESFKLEARIDRIDVIATEDGQQAYAIVDYKSSLTVVPVEQLLVYDYVLRQDQTYGRKLEGKDTILAFQRYKINSKDEYEVEYITHSVQEGKLIRKGKSTVEIDYSSFETWLDMIVQKIFDEGAFYPKIVEEEPIDFVSYSGQELGTKSKRKFECDAYNRKCPFLEVCKFLNGR